MSEYPGSKQERSGAARHILVLDDEIPVRDALWHLFRSIGCNCSVASTGEEVLEMVEQAADAKPPFDLALFDIKISNGMGGIETMRTFQQKGITLPVVSMSAYSLAEIFPSEDDRCGFIEHLQKPFNVEELKRVIEQVPARPCIGN